MYDDELWDTVREQIQAAWGERSLDQRVSWVQDCIHKRNYMSVFRLDAADSAKDIDVAILQALLKGKRCLQIVLKDKLCVQVVLEGNLSAVTT